MTVAISIIIVLALSLVLATSYALGQSRRNEVLREQMLEHRAAMAFIRLQMGSVGRRFADLWADGTLYHSDFALSDEWQTFRADFIRQALENE